MSSSIAVKCNCCNQHQTCLAPDFAGAVLLLIAAVPPTLLDGILKQDVDIVPQLPGGFLAISLHDST